MNQQYTSMVSHANFHLCYKTVTWAIMVAVSEILQRLRQKLRKAISNSLFSWRAGTLRVAFFHTCKLKVVILRVRMAQACFLRVLIEFHAAFLSIHLLFFIICKENGKSFLLDAYLAG